MIDCEEAERRLHRFLDRELNEAESLEVQLHLDACENCRARFRFEGKLLRLVRQAGRDEKAPPDLGRRIRDILARR